MKIIAVFFAVCLILTIKFVLTWGINKIKLRLKNNIKNKRWDNENT